MSCIINAFNLHNILTRQVLYTQSERGGNSGMQAMQLAQGHTVGTCGAGFQTQAAWLPSPVQGTDHTTLLYPASARCRGATSVSR